MMTVEPWRGVINGIHYGVQFEPELTDEIAARITRALLEEPLFDLTEAEEYDAIVAALQSDATLTAVDPDRHGEAEFRDFLRRLLSNMDAARPWPEPPFRSLGQAEWFGFAQAKPILRILTSYLSLQDRLHKGFGSVDHDGRRLTVLILRLKSGDEVALVTPWWRGSGDVAVLQRDPRRRSEDVVTEFLNATGLLPQEVTVLSGNAGQDSPDAR
jgi:hypothetical protein